ncbi:MAG: hypothetical protein ACREQY_11415, partial [Candidatus Binatia bacterium]
MLLRTTIALLALAIGAAPALAIECPPPDPELEGPPVAPSGGVVTPVRNDPGGDVTLTLLVEDPQDLPEAYDYGPRLEKPLSFGSPVGVFSHRWREAPNVVTHGLYFAIEGRRVRLPLLLTENASSTELGDSIVEAALQEAGPLAKNASPYALNSVTPSPLLPSLLPPLPLGVVSSLLRAWTMHENGYPQGSDYVERPPLYVWSVYRTAPGAQSWAGVMLLQSGTSGGSIRGGTTEREACRRT